MVHAGVLSLDKRVQNAYRQTETRVLCWQYSSEGRTTSNKKGIEDTVRLQVVCVGAHRE